MASSNEEAEDLLREILGSVTVMEVEEHVSTPEEAPSDVVVPMEMPPAWTPPPAPMQAIEGLSNHRFTVSLDLKGPHVVVRGQSAEEIAEGYGELEPHIPTIVARFWSRMKSEMDAAQGIGQAPMQTPPAAPQWPAQGGGAPNYNPQMPPPQMGGQAPAAWQNVGAPAPAMPQATQYPPGWYKFNFPFPQKAVFDAIVAQHGFRKGDPHRGGQVSFDRATKTWHCAPEIVGAFAQFNPVPAGA